MCKLFLMAGLLGILALVSLAIGGPLLTIIGGICLVIAAVVTKR